MSPRLYFVTITSTILCLFAAYLQAGEYELSGDITIEGRYFFHSPTFEEQEHHNGSLGLNGEFYHEFESGSSVTISPFVRLDNVDSKRTHADFRELNFIYLGESWELKAGVSKIFWGAAEFVHLIDIINQTDLVEDIYGEEKLGQPMIHVAFTKDWGVIDGIVLPYFRERTFPGEEGRLRTASVVDTDKAKYESGAEQYHPDFALRYSQTFGNLDWGVYQFIGTSREPTLIEEMDESASSVLVPYYPQITQSGLDVQVVQGEWLWKGEAMYRSEQGSSFAAFTCGIEYTLYGVLNTPMDAGLIVEYVFDDRDETVAAVYDNDLMAGLRLSFNDMENSEILGGIIKDTDLSSAIFSLEASRRLSESIKIKLSGGFFSNISEEDPAYDLRKDDYIKVEAIFYY